MSEQVAAPDWLFGDDGLHEILEDMHRVGRERVESSILAHLLRHRAYRKAFLEHCAIPWPEGEDARVRCEVGLDEGGTADIVVEWVHQGDRRLLIEHKPWAEFTDHQPANYVRHLRDDDVSHAAFVLLVNNDDKVDEARRRILQRRAVPGAPAGSAWSTIEATLRSEARSRWMKYRKIDALVQALAEVDGPRLHRALAAFWRSRHTTEEIEIPEGDQRRVRALLDELRLEGCSTFEDLENFGVYLTEDWSLRHSTYVWFGVEPPVARQLGVAAGAILVTKGGYLHPRVAKPVDQWATAHGFAWRPVQTGIDVSEWALTLADDSAAAALDDLATRLGLRRRRGRM